MHWKQAIPQQFWVGVARQPRNKLKINCQSLSQHAVSDFITITIKNQSLKKWVKHLLKKT